MSRREEVLREALLPEKLAPLLEGETDEELAASAHSVASELGIRPAASEAVLLARSALKHAAEMRALFGTEPDPNAGVGITSEPREKEMRIPTKEESAAALINLLHPSEGGGDE